MVGGPCHEIDMLSRVNLDLLPTIRRVHDQSVRIQVSEINECAENHSPKERLLESLQLSGEVLLSE
jgi:hypothetical protein